MIKRYEPQIIRKERRTAKQSLALIGVSLVPLSAVICFMRSKVLQHILAGPILVSVIALGFWVGRRAYLLLSINHPDDPLSSSEDAPVNWAALDWGSLIASIIVGLTVMLFMRELFTHEMVRAFDAIDLEDD